ncbi:hypothetical protein Btru_043107 [Bulinus truncatus]|nr:hypothetical protein Btru_043107 [Bulinus truncatus]
MFYKIVLVISLFATFVDADCINTCTQTYVNSVMSHATSQTLICRDIETFVHCIFGTGCNTSGISEKDILNLMDQYLKLYGFSCSFSTSDLYNKYKNSGTQLSSLSMSLVLTISLGLAALSWMSRGLQLIYI